MANDLVMRVVLNMQERVSAQMKRISGGANNAARSLQATSDRLKELQTQQRRLNEFQSLKRGLKQTSIELSIAQQKTRDVGSQLARLKAQADPAASAVKKLTAEQKKAQAVVDKLNASYRTNLERNREMAAGLTASGIPVMKKESIKRAETSLRDRIALTNVELAAQQKKIVATARLQERMKTARSDYSKGVHTAAAMGGTGMAARATGVYTGEKLKTMLGVGYEFDAIMSSTQAVTRVADKNSAAMQALRHQARTLPLSSKFTDSEVAKGQYFLGRTGYNPEQILGAMPGMLNLAAAGDMELGMTADIASNIQTAMGIPAEKMGQVADVLTAAFTRNNVDIQMLGESLKYSAGVGREYGQSLETVTAATALLGNAGVQGSMAGTAMRSVLTRMGNSKAVAKLGVTTQDGDGNMRDLLDILNDINAKTKDMGNVERGAVYKDIAGQYAVTSFGTLMRAVETGQFQSMRGSLNHADGEAAAVAATQLDNLKGDMTMLHAALENISVELFDKNSPWLRELSSDLSHLMHGVGEFLKEHPAVSKALVVTIAGFAVLMTTLGTLTIGLAGILGPMIAVRFMLSMMGIHLPSLISLIFKLGGAFRFAQKAALWLGHALKTNPIGLAVTAIAGAALLIYLYWEPLKQFFSGLWDDIKAISVAVWEWLTNFIVRVGQGIADFFMNWTLPGLIITHWDQISAAASVVWDWLKHIAIAAGQSIADFFMNWTLPDLLIQHWNDITGFLSGLAPKFMTIGGQIMQGLVNGFLGGATALKNAIQSVGASAITWFKEKLGIHSPSRAFAELGDFTMQGLAVGVERTENEPLAAVSRMARKLTGLGAGIAIGAAGMPAMAFDTRPALSPNVAGAMVIQGDTISISIQATPGMNEQAIARAIAAELDRREREKASRLRSMLHDRY